MLAAAFLIGATFLAAVLGRWGRTVTTRAHPFIDPTVTGFLGRLLQVLCYVVALIIYANLVPELRKMQETIIASAGLLSLVIGLAAQNALGNLIAGFTLLMYRPFDLGDVLTLSLANLKETGTVKEFTLGYTKLVSDDGRWIIVPNSVMASSVIIRVK